jgi:hypothetical protein
MWSSLLGVLKQGCKQIKIHGAVRVQLSPGLQVCPFLFYKYEIIFKVISLSETTCQS